MDETMGTLSKGSAEERNAVFERVWKRVMEGRTDTEGSPIVWGENRAAQETEAHGSLQGEEETAQETALLPMGSQRAQGDRAHSDFPQGQVGFLGDSCLDCVPMIQEMIRHELADWREYQTLARRVGGHQAKAFQALANEEKRHAKRLSAAYFLISGVRYCAGGLEWSSRGWRHTWPERKPPRTPACASSSWTTPRRSGTTPAESEPWWSRRN